jgi:hypothetical protein
MQTRAKGRAHTAMYMRIHTRTNILRSARTPYTTCCMQRLSRGPMQRLNCVLMQRSNCVLIAALELRACASTRTYKLSHRADMHQIVHAGVHLTDCIVTRREIRLLRFRKPVATLAPLS